MELRVDGRAVSVSAGSTILEACDRAGRYVPRLCFYPGLGRACDHEAAEAPDACGLCVVRLDAGSGGETTVLACCTAAQPGMTVVTDGPDLQAERLERLAGFLAHHPHVCLSCLDRDGCTREECTFGIPVEARCCDQFGRCEFGKLVSFIDARGELPRRLAAVARDASTEGRIRREPGLCLGCGRCVLVCGSSPAAGNALRLVRAGKPGSHPGLSSVPYIVALPKMDTLRASGCTFCGQCVMVCPAGAVTAPGDTGASWLEGWRRRTGLPTAVLPPDAWRALTRDEWAAVPALPGVFLLADDAGRILRIAGVADLSQGIASAVAEPACSAATCFRIEAAPLFTQRESELLARFTQMEGRLPPGNDLSDDLFSDDL